MSGLREPAELRSRKHELVADLLRLAGKAKELGMRETVEAVEAAAYVAGHELLAELGEHP